jgi:hypothetical protein
MEPRIDMIEHNISASVVVAIIDPSFPGCEGEDDGSHVAGVEAGEVRGRASSSRSSVGGGWRVRGQFVGSKARG